MLLVRASTAQGLSLFSINAYFTAVLTGLLMMSIFMLKASLLLERVAECFRLVGKKIDEFLITLEKSQESVTSTDSLN